MWSASSRPLGFSLAYLRLNIACGCVICGTFVPPDLIWQSRGKKITLVKHCWFAQMWSVLGEPFWTHASLISQLRVTVELEVRPRRPCADIHTLTGTRCTTVSRQLSVISQCTHASPLRSYGILHRAKRGKAARSKWGCNFNLEHTDAGNSSL